MTKTAQQIRDEVAKERGYKSFKHAVEYKAAYDGVTEYPLTKELTAILDIATERYAKQEPTADLQTLLNLLLNHGGEIVCTASLDVNDINQARASERMYVDENGIGFVWMPKLERMPQTVEEVKFFEKWWPLDVEMPEELKNPEWLFKALEKEEKLKSGSTADVFGHKTAIDNPIEDTTPPPEISAEEPVLAQPTNSNDWPTPFSTETPQLVCTKTLCAKKTSGVCDNGKCILDDQEDGFTKTMNEVIRKHFGYFGKSVETGCNEIIKTALEYHRLNSQRKTKNENNG